MVLRVFNLSNHKTIVMYKQTTPFRMVFSLKKAFQQRNRQYEYRLSMEEWEQVWYLLFLKQNNPNIYPESEYLNRVQEQERLICQMPVKNGIKFIESGFRTQGFYSAVGRCFKC